MGQISLQLPVAGQPNTSEDPKVVNDMTILQTLLNGNIDPSNLNPTGGIWHLAWRIANANTTATSGDLINAGAGVTVTLPAPTSGALVGVWAGTAVTAAAPVTVSGTNIYGVGIPQVASLTLGVPGASVLLQSDGTNWIIVAGGQDTGWIPLTLGANVAATGSGWAPPTVRVRGDTGALRGSVTTTGALGSGSTLVTLPAVAMPAFTFAFGAVYWNGSSMIPTDLKYAPGGALSSIVALGASSQFFLDGFTYSLT